MLLFEQAVLLATTIHAHGLWRVQAIEHIGDGWYEIAACPILEQRLPTIIATQDAWEQARIQEEEKRREPTISHGRPRRHDEGEQQQRRLHRQAHAATATNTFRGHPPSGAETNS